MLSIVVAMAAIVAVAALVLYYVAYPHRDDSDGSERWLGRTMHRARASLPTLGDPDEDDAPSGSDGPPAR